MSPPSCRGLPRPHSLKPLPSLRPKHQTIASSPSKSSPPPRLKNPHTAKPSIATFSLVVPTNLKTPCHLYNSHTHQQHHLQTKAPPRSKPQHKAGSTQPFPIHSTCSFETAPSEYPLCLSPTFYVADWVGKEEGKSPKKEEEDAGLPQRGFRPKRKRYSKRKREKRKQWREKAIFIFCFISFPTSSYFEYLVGFPKKQKGGRKREKKERKDKKKWRGKGKKRENGSILVYFISSFGIPPNPEHWRHCRKERERSSLRKLKEKV